MFHHRLLRLHPLRKHSPSNHRLPKLLQRSLYHRQRLHQARRLQVRSLSPLSHLHLRPMPQFLSVTYKPMPHPPVLLHLHLLHLHPPLPYLHLYVCHPCHQFPHRSRGRRFLLLHHLNPYKPHPHPHLHVTFSHPTPQNTTPPFCRRSLCPLPFRPFIKHLPLCKAPQCLRLRGRFLRRSLLLGLLRVGFGRIML